MNGHIYVIRRHLFSATILASLSLAAGTEGTYARHPRDRDTSCPVKHLGAPYLVVGMEATNSAKGERALIDAYHEACNF